MDINSNTMIVQQRVITLEPSLSTLNIFTTCRLVSGPTVTDAVAVACQVAVATVPGRQVTTTATCYCCWSSREGPFVGAVLARASRGGWSARRASARGACGADTSRRGWRRPREGTCAWRGAWACWGWAGACAGGTVVAASANDNSTAWPHAQADRLLAQTQMWRHQR